MRLPIATHFPTRRSSDLNPEDQRFQALITEPLFHGFSPPMAAIRSQRATDGRDDMRYAVVIEKGQSNYSAYVPDLPGCVRSEEHTSELQSLRHLVCRLLL